MANLLMALTFGAALLYGYRVMARLERFLESGRIEREDDAP